MARTHIRICDINSYTNHGKLDGSTRMLIAILLACSLLLLIVGSNQLQAKDANAKHNDSGQAHSE
ncbi:MAG: hypothetical protein JKY67_20125 [Pseudomonadales bacterium]|nr:hypothetical protein [Pseudomonadales bacterium]